MAFNENKKEQTKYQILIHLKNVIVRNWGCKKKNSYNNGINGTIKKQVRE
jgi:hypothetical protein